MIRTGTGSTFCPTCCPKPQQRPGRVDYEVMVPADASVTLRSSTGPLRAEGLHGDVILEGSQANVEVRDISNAHVHVKTLNGLVTLSNIRNGHVEITSVSGNVTSEISERPAGAGQLHQRQDPL